MPAPDGSSEHPCGRCAQGEELRRFVAELREEVSRLRSIRESEREIFYWNRTLPSPGQPCQADRTHDTEDSLSSPHLAERSDSHNWNAAMDGYKLFRRDRQGRRGSGIAMCVRECFD